MPETRRRTTHRTPLVDHDGQQRSRYLASLEYGLAPWDRARPSSTARPTDASSTAPAAPPAGGPRGGDRP